MTQQIDSDRREQALAYARHQAAKSLAELAAMMERTGEDCARCLEGVSEAQAAFAHDEEWSMKEVLGHMLESSHSINREIANLAEGRPSSAVGRIGHTPGGDRPVEELRRELAELWVETGRLVASLSESASLEPTREHPWFGPLNFREWIAFQRMHALDHVEQMEKLKAHPHYPKE
jgi:hypothetical protein